MISKMCKELGFSVNERGEVGNGVLPGEQNWCVGVLATFIAAVMCPGREGDGRGSEYWLCH